MGCSLGSHRLVRRVALESRPTSACLPPQEASRAPSRHSRPWGPCSFLGRRRDWPSCASPSHASRQLRVWNGHGVRAEKADGSYADDPQSRRRNALARARASERRSEASERVAAARDDLDAIRRYGSANTPGEARTFLRAEREAERAVDEALQERNRAATDLREANRYGPAWWLGRLLVAAVAIGIFAMFGGRK